LAGRETAHHSFWLTKHLSAWEYLDEARSPQWRN
jgi:hypothetical protein